MADLFYSLWPARVASQITIIDKNFSNYSFGILSPKTTDCVWNEGIGSLNYKIQVSLPYIKKFQRALLATFFEFLSDI